MADYNDYLGGERFRKKVGPTYKPAGTCQPASGVGEQPASGVGQQAATTEHASTYRPAPGVADKFANVDSSCDPAFGVGDQV